MAPSGAHESRKSSVGVLVAARDSAVRRTLSRALDGEWAPIEVDPSRLEDAGSLLDAAAIVIYLGGRDDAKSIAMLATLKKLPAGRAMLLLVGEDADPDPVAAALLELDPTAVLGYPVSEALLRFALLRTFPARTGKGSRDGQRRAPVLMGVSSAIRDLLEQVRGVAASKMSVLILGETGTGKELVARAIHDQSGRRDEPFVAVNCAALPETLLESELFGYVKGAFTGADREKRGLFESANRGTLFLDEVGETSPALQAKLLRALEAQEIRPVGGSQVRRIDVRFVSATNCDLEAAVEQSAFRRDLYYRINTATLLVPPLRRRRVDIPFLAQHFAEEFGVAGAQRIVLDEEFLEALTSREFRGNVRELRNTVERAIALADPTEPIGVRHLQEFGSDARIETPVATGTLRERIQQVEIDTIREALAHHDGNRTRSADTLGISRLSLRNKMRRLGLETVSRG